MKMKKDHYTYILEQFKKHHKIIESEAKKLRESGHYQCFYTRLGWDALRYVTREDNNERFITEVLYASGLNDSHINTGIKRALKAIGINE